MTSTRWLALVLAAAGLWLFLHRRAQKHERLAPVAKVSKVAAPPPPAPVAKAASSVAGLTPEALRLARAEDKLGLQRAGYVMSGQQRLLVAKFEPLATCQAGDLDFIKIATRGTAPLVVSLERIDGGLLHLADDGARRSVHVSDLQEGVTLRLEVKATDLAAYGLFICTDRSNTHSCRGKPAANLQDPLAGRVFGRPPDDAVFYFQSFLLDDKKIYVFGGAGAGDGSKILPYLALRHAEGQTDAVKEAAQLSSKLASREVSVAKNPDGNGNFMLVTLPYLEPTQCETSANNPLSE